MGTIELRGLLSRRKKKKRIPPRIGVLCDLKKKAISTNKTEKKKKT